MEGISVGIFFEEVKEKLKLEMVNGQGNLDKTIKKKELHRPGLALSGFVDVFTYQRIQILGNTELAYLSTLTSVKREAALRRFLEFDIPCIIVTNSNIPPEELINIADQKEICVFQTSFSTTELIHQLGGYLNHKFAPTITIHGSLVDVYGIGVLFTGRSGIGKSEIALDLIERGHRLVADDVVNITREAENIIIGRGSETLAHHMEIRGLGIIDIRSMFGIRAIRGQKRIEVEVQLEEWGEDKDYERTGLEEHTTRILDVEIPVVKLPIFPGKNITVIAEVIALDQLLKIYGYYPAQEFNKRLISRIRSKFSLKNYLEHDYE